MVAGGIALGSLVGWLVGLGHRFTHFRKSKGSSELGIYSVLHIPCYVLREELDSEQMFCISLTRISDYEFS